MKKQSDKLVLNQETLRTLTHSRPADLKPTNNSCVKSVCFPVCTPAGGMN